MSEPPPDRSERVDEASADAVPIDLKKGTWGQLSSFVTLLFRGNWSQVIAVVLRTPVVGSAALVAAVFWGGYWFGQEAGYYKGRDDATAENTKRIIQQAFTSFQDETLNWDDDRVLILQPSEDEAVLFIQLQEIPIPQVTEIAIRVYRGVTTRREFARNVAIVHLVAEDNAYGSMPTATLMKDTIEFMQQVPIWVRYIPDQLTEDVPVDIVQDGDKVNVAGRVRYDAKRIRWPSGKE